MNIIHYDLTPNSIILSNLKLQVLGKYIIYFTKSVGKYYQKIENWWL